MGADLKSLGGLRRQEYLCKRLVSNNKALGRVTSSKEVCVLMGRKMTEFEKKDCRVVVRGQDGYLTRNMDVGFPKEICRGPKKRQLGDGKRKTT